MHATPTDDGGLDGGRAADTELVRRCVEREPRAWDDLVARHVAVLSAAAGRVLGASGDAEVEDALQSVFFRLWDDGCRRLRTFEGRSRLSTWLVVLARREALDRVRARRNRRETEAEGRLAAPAGAEGDAAAQPSLAAEERDELERLLRAVDTLPPRERLLVRLVWMDGCAYADAARLLAVPENSISPWLSRARAKLREALGSKGSTYGSPGSGTPTRSAENHDLGP